MGKHKPRSRGVDVTKRLLPATSVVDRIAVQVAPSQVVHVTAAEISHTQGSDNAFAFRRDGKLDATMRLCNNWRAGGCHNAAACTFAHVNSYLGAAASVPAGEGSSRAPSHGAAAAGGAQSPAPPPQQQQQRAGQSAEGPAPSRDSAATSAKAGGVSWSDRIAQQRAAPAAGRRRAPTGALPAQAQWGASKSAAQRAGGSGAGFIDLQTAMGAVEEKRQQPQQQQTSGRGGGGGGAAPAKPPVQEAAAATVSDAAPAPRGVEDGQSALDLPALQFAVATDSAAPHVAEEADDVAPAYLWHRVSDDAAVDALADFQPVAGLDWAADDVLSAEDVCRLPEDLLRCLVGGDSPALPPASSIDAPQAEPDLSAFDATSYSHHLGLHSPAGFLPQQQPFASAATADPLGAFRAAPLDTLLPMQAIPHHQHQQHQQQQQQQTAIPIPAFSDPLPPPFALQAPAYSVPPAEVAYAPAPTPMPGPDPSSIQHLMSLLTGTS